MAALTDESPDPDVGRIVLQLGDLYRDRRTFVAFEMALQNQLDAKRRELTRPPETPRWTTAQANAAFAKDARLAVAALRWEGPQQAAIAAHHKSRLEVERAMVRLPARLPVFSWVASVRGFGALGLALIAGECGDLGNYANPAKVWKRMGLAVLPDGTRQRPVSGTTEEEARAIGYVARRRSVMYVVGASLLKGNRGGYYKEYYDGEKCRQLAKWPEPVMVKGAGGKLIDIRKLLAHRRAQRHMEKRLLRDLWRAWHGQGGAGDDV